MVKSNRDLKVWQRAIDMTLSIYGAATTGFPKQEMFGLTSRIRHAAVSAASNIGCKQFLAIARGSNLEVQTQLLIATELAYGTLLAKL